MNFKKMRLNDIESEGYRIYQIAGRDLNLWQQSTDCFLYLMEHGVNARKKAQYANTLGYIYYYGRVNNFTPEYDKAFKYFSIGAEGGYLESMYKLGDMYLNGYYVEKNPEQAVRLYTQVYEYVEHEFREEEFGGVFADISLRLASLYRQGIGCRQDDRKALFIYTMADYAIRERMKESDFFGNRKVADSITKELTELQNKLHTDTAAELLTADYPQALPLVMTDGYEAAMTFTQDGGKVTIDAERVDPDNEDYWIPRIPVIFSEYGYVGFYDILTETAVGVTEYELYTDDDRDVPVDEIRYDENTDRYEFCHQGRINVVIKAEGFHFKLDRD